VVGRHVAALAGLLGAAVGTALLGDAEACPIDPHEVVAPGVLPPRPTVYIGWYLGLPSYPDAWGELERWTAKVTPPAAVVIDPWADVAPWVAPTDRDGHPIRFTIDRIVVADEVILAVHLDATSGQVTLGPQAPGWAPRVELPTDVTSVYDPYRAIGAARPRPTTDVHVRPGIVDSFYGTAGGLLVGRDEPSVAVDIGGDAVGFRVITTAHCVDQRVRLPQTIVPLRCLEEGRRFVVVSYGFDGSIVSVPVDVPDLLRSPPRGATRPLGLVGVFTLGTLAALGAGLLLRRRHARRTLVG